MSVRRDWSYKFGDLDIYYVGGSSDSKYQSKTGGAVVYDNIKLTYNKDNLWEDEDFPASVEESIGPIGGDSAAGIPPKPPAGIVWARPFEMAKSGMPLGISFGLAQDGERETYSASDLKQGEIGDCWYLAALQALTTRQEQLKVVIPEDNYNGFLPENYCGAFHFRFFSPEYERWYDIVVDDRIPCHKIPGSGLLYSAFTAVTAKLSTRVAEFWPVLIEKAYAKFIGSYAKVEGGWSSQALVNFSGGFSEIIRFQPEKLETFGLPELATKSEYDMVKQKIIGFLQSGYFLGLDTYAFSVAYERGILDGYSLAVWEPPADNPAGLPLERSVGCKYDPATKQIVPDKTQSGLGLVGPHAYTILDAQSVKSKDGSQEYFLVKLRNPHAKHEWLGDFNDKDDERWETLEKDLRTSKDPEDGIFWIELNDILKYFNLLETCAFGLGDTKACRVEGVWPAALQSAELQTADKLRLCKPYKFTAGQGSGSKDYAEQLGNKCMICVSVILGGYHARLTPPASFTFALYKVTEEDLTKPFEAVMNEIKPVETGPWCIGRESSKILIKEAGTYVILPLCDSVRVPTEFVGKDMDFVIRLFTETETSLEPIQMSAS